MALSSSKRVVLKWLSLLSVIITFALGSYELFHWFTHVYEFDARIRSDLTRISSRVNGTIETIAVREGDKVKIGDLLVIMKTGAVTQRIEAIKADLAGAIAKQAKLRAEKYALEVDLGARIATKREILKALKVERQALADRHILALKKLKRTRYLVQRNLASQNVLDSDQDKVLDLSGKIKVAEAKVNVAAAEIGEIDAKSTDIKVFDKDIEILAIEALRLKAKLRELEVDLAERVIKSPIDGVIDRVFKNPGEYVEDAEELIILHDPKNIWIEANIDEDQIRHLKVGQPVKVDLDAYPFDTFKGEVIGIGMVTVQDLSLAKKSDVNVKARKITQRIPVKINLLNPPDLAAPGMLVEVNIQIRDKANLP